ncbi:MAG: response regulator transcription factor [Microcoleus sp. C1-bin4]|nr:response regulator transcription factor [Microcoleus sp. C1-bin4]
MYFLASYSGQSWSRQQLSEKIWAWKCEETGKEQVVIVHIGQIRKKMIQVDATGPGFIKTIGGYGYRFDPPHRTAMAIYEAHRH